MIKKELIFVVDPICSCSVVIIDEEGHMVCHKGYQTLLEMKKLLE